MIVVIDGYNMLRQIFPGVKGKLDAQRNYLIQQLSKYKHYKKDSIHDIIIVFDAGPLHHATREIHGGIVVMYSGQKSSADDWIISYVKKHHDQEFVIVTKDREVIQACKQYNMQELDGASFYELITDTIKQIMPHAGSQVILYDQQIKKYDTLDDYHLDEELDQMSPSINRHELDFLMQKESTFVQKKDESETRLTKKNKAKTLSKKEKKLYAILKKLS